jgi:hypothetical protein
MKKIAFFAVFTVIIFSSFYNGYHQRYTTSALRMSSDTTLPDSYKNRKFLSDMAGLDFDPATAPGNIVKYDSASSGYEFLTLKAIIKGGKPAIAQKLADAVIFSGKVTSTSSFNGSYLINGISVKKSEEMDINLRDDAVYSVPDGQVDTATIRDAVKSLSASELINLFYITSATVTIINYNIHPKPNVTMQKVDKLSKGKPDTVKNGTYYKIKESKTPPPYSSSGSNVKMFTDKTISIIAIPVADLLATAPVKK